jgi:hypothetical protein
MPIMVGAKRLFGDRKFAARRPRRGVRKPAEKYREFET